jgi:hypothetical protein
MCTDKSHIYFLIDEEHYGYNAIIVSFDVKNISVIANIVDCVESLFDIGKVVPVCLANTLVPVTKWYVGICMLGNKFPYHGK